MIIHSGDILLSGPTVGNAELTQLGIQLTGSISTHAETVAKARNGRVRLGDAKPPHFVLTPWEQRIAEASGPKPKRNMVLLRWREWWDAEDRELYVTWQSEIASVIAAFALLKIPYDTAQIAAFAQDYIRQRTKRKPRGRVGTEHHLQCVESCHSAFLAAQSREINMFRSIPPQPKYAPIHVERCIMAGDWVVVEDWGMMERIRAKQGGKRSQS